MIGQLSKINNPRRALENSSIFSVIRTPFGEGLNHRKLIIMVDSECLEDSETLNKVFVLKDLLSSKNIDCYRYSDEGVPSGLKPINNIPFCDEPAFEGWVAVYESEGNLLAPWDAVYLRNDNHSISGIRKGKYDNAFEDKVEGVYSELSGLKRGKQQQKDFLALEVAMQGLQADIFITNREYLFSDTKLMSGLEVAVYRPEDALSLVALYLRDRGEFILPTGTPKFKVSYSSKSRFFWEAAHELIEGAEDLLYFASKNANTDQKSALLIASCLSRVSRALQVRDSLHKALNMSISNDSYEDVLSSVDYILLLMMGAFDSLARLVDHKFQLNSKKNDIGWQKGAWRQKLTEKNSSLASLITDGSLGANVIDIARLLRNSVHGEALQAFPLGERDKSEWVIALPTEDQVDLIKAMNILGGSEAWGIQQLTSTRQFIQPGVFTDQLLSHVFDILGAFIKEVNSELNIPPGYAKEGNKKKGLIAFNSKESRLNIRWQLGF